MSAKKLTATREELVQLYEQHDAVAIAKMYGCTSGAVYARMKALAIPRRGPSEYVRHYPDLTKDQLSDLYAEHSQIEIAALLDVSQEWVRSQVRKHGIKTKPRKRTFEISKERLQTLYNDHSMREIAFMLGVGETVVFKRIKEYGITLDQNHRERTGKVFSEEHRSNLSKAQVGLQRGEMSPTWKGGLTSQSRIGRGRAIYRMWKTGALRAADNKCQRCGAHKGDSCECCGQKIILHVHHKKSYANHPELRYAPENAEVLCAKCHYAEHF